MTYDFVLPELGENISTATVVELFVKVGDSVAVEQPILSLETDKAEFELPSPSAGMVTEILVGVGDDVSVGQLLLRLGLDADRSVATLEQGENSTSLPASSDSHAAAGGSEPSHAGRARQRQEESTVDKQSAPEIAAPVRRQAGDVGDVGDAPAQTSAGSESAQAVETGGLAPGAARSGGTARTEHEEQTRHPEVPVAAAPSVRRLARALGVDLADVQAADPSRLTADDVERHVRELLSRHDGGPGSAAIIGSAGGDYERYGEVDVESMSKVRRRTAERMAAAWAQIPHVTHHDLADITELDRLRRVYAGRVERAGGKLTVTAVLLKVVASALKRFPKFNSTVDMESSAIVHKKYVNLGVAVDTAKGLLVPVLHNADHKNIVELALALRDLSERARNRNITPDLLQGGTFTITNLGGIGGVAFSPLINPPEVAVLGVATADRRAVCVDDRFEARLMLPLSLSYDHRVIDGADAARFLRWVCEALEEPFVMDLEGE